MDLQNYRTIVAWWNNGYFLVTQVIRISFEIYGARHLRAICNSISILLFRTFIYSSKWGIRCCTLHWKIKYFIRKMMKFIKPAIFSGIPKLIISKVSSISNHLELKYLIELFQICWTWQHLQNKCSQSSLFSIMCLCLCLDVSGHWSVLAIIKLRCCCFTIL